MRKKKKLSTRLLDLFFPPKCPFCHGLLRGRERFLCDRCGDEISWADAAPLREVEHVNRCVSPLWYRGRTKETVRRYKFSGKSWYAIHFGPLMANAVRVQTDVMWDVLTWVPLSKERLRERGYDQARLLAEELGRVAGCEPVQVLRKLYNTKEQSSLKDHAERRANVLGVYEVISPELVAGKRILLVDDVVTSGATLSQCALMLRAAGASDVFAVTLARAGEGG